MNDGKIDQAMISVIMPTYNQAEFIGEAIESALKQTYCNFELFIINNYSNDDTENIVQSYTDERIKYYKFRNFGIIAASRNFAINKATGEYIAFLDSDDIWRPEKLEKQVALMETKKDVALSYVLFANLFEDGSIEGEYPKSDNRYRGNIFPQLYLLNSIPNSGAMVRTCVLEQVGLLDENTKLVGVEDADLWLRIALEKPVDYVDNDVLMLYRIGSKKFYYNKLFKKLQRRIYLAKKFSCYSGTKAFFRKILMVHASLILKRLQSELN